MSILFIIIALGILILAHEVGHFVAAKLLKIRVDEFGLGFPPKLLSIKKRGTIYSLNLFPIGGFVKIYGTDGSGKDDSSSFSSRSVLQRAIVIISGILMNILVAYLVFIVLFSVGFPQSIDENNRKFAQNIQTGIVLVQENTPAQTAGFKAGDLIMEISNSDSAFYIAGVDSFKKIISENLNKEIFIKIKRGEEMKEISITPRSSHPQDQGPIGVVLSEIGMIKFPWYLAPIYTIKFTISLVWYFISGLAFIIWKLITVGGVGGPVFVGPIGVVGLATDALNLGWVYALSFGALISINLAILNILPFPALDGGWLLFLIIEKIKGSPVPKKVENFIHSLGFAILILLMIIVTIGDIKRLL